ncbi:MAG: sortase [Oscillospiraceae bacterium]|nr:sortase [Oscillospiraceae bacterium]MBQ7130378.1 sortase [Oscillospiraceae bacterium]
MAKKRAGSVFVVMGAVLMLSALLLYVYNTLDARRAGNEANQALDAMQAAIVQNQLSLNENSEQTAYGETTSENDPADVITEPEKLEPVEIDGYYYIGFLSVPEFELDLPVQSMISEDRLYKSPCLQFGSPITDDAVIAGHNYKYHFLPLHNIEIGEKVTFTYMNGYTVEYSVSDVSIVHPTNIAAVQHSEHDFVMYTCTSGGSNRVAVFCDRTEPNVQNEDS